MLVSPALAGHPMVNTGNSGGVYMSWKKWRRKQAARDDTDVSKNA